jgi:hypothetical protein
MTRIDKKSSVAVCILGDIWTMIPRTISKSIFIIRAKAFHPQMATDRSLKSKKGRHVVEIVVRVADNVSESGGAFSENV